MSVKLIFWPVAIDQDPHKILEGRSKSSKVLCGGLFCHTALFPTQQRRISAVLETVLCGRKGLHGGHWRTLEDLGGLLLSLGELYIESGQ